MLDAYPLWVLGRDADQLNAKPLLGRRFPVKPVRPFVSGGHGLGLILAFHAATIVGDWSLRDSAAQPYSQRMDILTLLVLIAAGVVALVAQYFIIQAAVLSALRQHTMNSTAAVSVVSSVPLQVAATGPES